jgi:hypothetical protein
MFSCLSLVGLGQDQPTGGGPGNDGMLLSDHFFPRHPLSDYHLFSCGCTTAASGDSSVHLRLNADDLVISHRSQRSHRSQMSCNVVVEQVLLIEIFIGPNEVCLSVNTEINTSLIYE